MRQCTCLSFLSDEAFMFFLEFLFAFAFFPLLVFIMSSCKGGLLVLVVCFLFDCYIMSLFVPKDLLSGTLWSLASV